MTQEHINRENIEDSTQQMQLKKAKHRLNTILNTIENIHRKVVIQQVTRQADIINCKERKKETSPKAEERGGERERDVVHQDHEVRQQRSGVRQDHKQRSSTQWYRQVKLQRDREQHSHWHVQRCDLYPVREHWTISGIVFRNRRHLTTDGTSRLQRVPRRKFCCRSCGLRSAHSVLRFLSWGPALLLPSLGTEQTQQKEGSKISEIVGLFLLTRGR